MSDKLSPCARQLIDSYPECKIRRIPMGVIAEEIYAWNGSSLVGGYSWRKQIHKDFENGKSRKGNAASLESRSYSARQRQEKIRTIYSGQAKAELARMFGRSEKTIRNDMAKLRKEGWIK